MSNTIKVDIPKTELNQFLDDFTDITYKAKQSALKRGANVMKKAALQAITQAGFAYNTINSHPRKKQYSDSLQDGIRITPIKDDGNWIGVHILGSRASDSGTFRLRFFETGTRERWATTYNGRTLKKKRKLGKIDSSKFAFFESSVNSSQGEAIDAFQQQLEKYIQNAWNNG
jgi:hypothetical protein